MIGGTPVNKTKGIRGQFLDVIEYMNDEQDILVYKWNRADNEIKTGSKVIVRVGQEAAFIQGFIQGDILSPGNYVLNTRSLPILNKLKAIPFAMNSPIKSDVYFIGTTVKQARCWGTKNPIIVRDPSIGICRIRGFGKFSYRVCDTRRFMEEIVGARSLTYTLQVEEHIKSVILQSITDILGRQGLSIFDVAGNYVRISESTKSRANNILGCTGIRLMNISIENISMPDEVEAQIDKMSTLGMIRQNLDTYKEVETLEIMKIAAKQENGLAGAGMGLQIGGMVANTFGNSAGNGSIQVRCPECKELNNESSKFCQKCGREL